MKELTQIEINDLVVFYNMKNKTDLIKLLLMKHFNDLLKWNSLQLWNTIEDDVSFKASFLLKTLNKTYTYSHIRKLYMKEHWVDISESTLNKLKTKNRYSNVKHKVVYNIIKLFEKLDSIKNNPTKKSKSTTNQDIDSIFN